MRILNGNIRSFQLPWFNHYIYNLCISILLPIYLLRLLNIGKYCCFWCRYSSNVDETMHLIKLVGSDGRELGMINWFPVHATSMNKTNRLVSSDNKGLASVLFEQWKKDTDGNDRFVAAFAQANEGDVSPNTRGANCVDTGEQCDLLSSTCSDGKVNI